MFATRLRTTAVAFVATLSIGIAAQAVAPTAAQARVKASPTGNTQLDDYCAKVADLIDRALTESHLADGRSDVAASTQWRALAEYMLRDATSKGCRFELARTRQRSPRIADHPIAQVGR